MNHRAKLKAEGRDTRWPGERRGRHHGGLRTVVADEHQVHRHDRPPHHRQGGAVRPRHHGRRQQEADGAVLGEPEHDARQHRARQHRARQHGDGQGWVRRTGRAGRSATGESASAATAETTSASAGNGAAAASAAPTKRKISGPATEPIEVAGMAGPAMLKRLGARGARAARRVPAVAPTPLTRWTTGAAVRELLGREPRGDFDVVVRGDDGDPVVFRNAPLLDDGTPMPTRYWLIGPDEVLRVSQLEATGGVAPPRQQSTRRSSTMPTAGTRPSATRWCPTTMPARGPVAGSAAREPASSVSTRTTHGSSRAATTRSAAGSASSWSCRPRCASHSANRRRRSPCKRACPDHPARCGRRSCRGASSTSPRPSSKAATRHHRSSSRTPRRRR